MRATAEVISAFEARLGVMLGPVRPLELGLSLRVVAPDDKALGRQIARLQAKLQKLRASPPK